MPSSSSYTSPGPPWPRATGERGSAASTRPPTHFRPPAASRGRSQRFPSEQMHRIAVSAPCRLARQEPKVSQLADASHRHLGPLPPRRISRSGGCGAQLLDFSKPRQFGHHALLGGRIAEMEWRESCARTGWAPSPPAARRGELNARVAARRGEVKSKLPKIGNRRHSAPRELPPADKYDHLSIFQCDRCGAICQVSFFRGQGCLRNWAISVAASR